MAPVDWVLHNTVVCVVRARGVAAWLLVCVEQSSIRVGPSSENDDMFDSVEENISGLELVVRDPVGNSSEVERGVSNSEAPAI